MRPSVLFFVLLLSSASLPPSAAAVHKRPPAKVPKDQVQQYTDEEFQTVASVAGDNADQIQKAQGIFNAKVKQSASQSFTGFEVERVGPSVAKLIDASNQYWDAIRKARTPEDVHDAGAHFKATLTQAGVALPMIKAASAEIDAQGKHLENAMAAADPDSGVTGQQLMQAAAHDLGHEPSLSSVGPGHGKGPTNSELVRLALESTREALNLGPKPKPKPGTDPTPGGGVVTPAPGGGVVPGPGTGSNTGQAGHVPTTGDLLGSNDPKSPGDAMGDARERYRNGDVSGAIGDATRAISLGGGAPAYALRGGMLFDQQQYSAANADARQALQTDPRNTEARALLNFTEGRVGGGGGGGPAIAGGSGPGVGGRANGGGSGSAGGVPAAASGPTAAQRAAASRLSGEQAQKAAQNALALRDFSAAMAFADRALASNPNDAGMLNIRATAWARQREYAKGLADAKAAWTLAPKNGTILKTKGFLEARGGQYKDALGSANMLIEADPNGAYGYALRAQAEARLGDLDGYRADMARASALDSYYAKAAPASLAQVPSDSDLVFLFPGEEGPRPAAAAAPSRGRRFSGIVGASIVGGLLLAFGLLQTVMAPLKEQVSSVFTRITRTGPSVGALPEEAAARGPAAGLIRGQYEITRPIGAGGMGMVYEGTDRSLGRRVAIKKMRDELRADARERARFVSEAKTVAALHHPNIVDIYSIADQGDDVYLIFEFVDGKTVHDLVQAQGRLAPDLAAAIVDASADALEFAHGRGVIHRDMKPSNVMVDAAGRVKVMDFGIARMAKEAMTRYSMTNTVVGTPPYMAPEQEQGQVRRESDVYSLAVCAYEMLTGRLPFQGVGGGMSLNKINMSFVPPSRETPGLPPALDEVFARAFQADPERRYRAPKEFASALRAALPAAARA